jgi:hypothetical protein
LSIYASPKSGTASRQLFLAGAIVLASIMVGCDSQLFQTQPPAMPAAPVVPPQPPAPPLNPARMLDGNWMATYSGGPLRVKVGLDPMLRGRNYIATLIDGNKDIPAGQIVWKGVPNPSVVGLIDASQICAQEGFIHARWVEARIKVPTTGHFVEELVDPKDCKGFPVDFTRIGPPPVQAQAD